MAVNDTGPSGPQPHHRPASIASPDVGREVARDMAQESPRPAPRPPERRKPDYVAVFPSWVPGIGRDPRFTPVYTLPIPGNITMGDDQIVVYATPWTRFPLRPGG